MWWPWKPLLKVIEPQTNRDRHTSSGGTGQLPDTQLAVLPVRR